jgi:hypothetical protein
MSFPLAWVRLNGYESCTCAPAQGQLLEYRLKNWWMGVLMLDQSRRRQGSAQSDEAQREREFERRKRDREFKSNLEAWRRGRRDVHLW